MDDVPLPRIAITLGDPTGVGPEVIVAALQHKEIYRICHPVVIGRPEIVEQACRLLHLDSRVVQVTEDEFEKLAVSGEPSGPNRFTVSLVDLRKRYLRRTVASMLEAAKQLTMRFTKRPNGRSRVGWKRS